MGREQWGHGYWNGYWNGIQDACAGYKGTHAENIRECARKICLSVKIAEKEHMCHCGPKYLYECEQIFRMSKYSTGLETDILITAAFYYIWKFSPFDFIIGGNDDDRLDYDSDCLCLSGWKIDDIENFTQDDFADLEKERFAHNVYSGGV